MQAEARGQIKKLSSLFTSRMYIKKFNQLAKVDVKEAGGKGASLGEMIKAGISVPPGFVVLSQAFDDFIQTSDLETEIQAALDKVNHKKIHTIENASEKIQALIYQAAMPEKIGNAILSQFKSLKTRFVAVRSSATSEDSAAAAWAGQLDTFLNTTEKTLILNVKKCWASLFNPRAIFYRFEKSLHKQKVSVAVVIQKMIQSEVSGIAFSVHPITQDYNQLLIEAGLGLGEAVVSGQITPDSYVVVKRNTKILEKIINEQLRKLIKNNPVGTSWQKVSRQHQRQQKLSDKEIIKLSQLIKKIEKHYNFPVDIEWAKEKGKFYITQSRPITTLTGKIENKTAKETDNKNKIGKISSRNYDFLWTVGFPYLYCSMYLESGYIKRDFVACNEGRIHTLFVSRNEREKLSKQGLKLYTTGFKKYEHYIEKQHIINRMQLNTFLKQDLTKLSNHQLAQNFYKTIELCIQMWKDYFLTEYHSSDLVSQILISKDNRYDLKQLQRNTHRMAKLKFWQRENLNKTMYTPSIFDKYISEIEKRLSLKWDIKNYSYHELLGFLQGKKSKNVPDRSSFVVRGLFSDNKDILGEKAEQLFKQLQNIDKNLKQFRGNIGNKGFYKGRVKIIQFSIDTDFSKEIQAMRKGQVLVSGSTGPEMILACKKAGAIITDEGGIISHAALVSRELGIPAIIGTKVATKILKNGDLVEVDANNGIVKILS